jgi:hypothetical protein
MPSIQKGFQRETLAHRGEGGVVDGRADLAMVADCDLVRAGEVLRPARRDGVLQRAEGATGEPDPAGVAVAAACIHHEPCKLPVPQLSNPTTNRRNRRHRRNRRNRRGAHQPGSGAFCTERPRATPFGPPAVTALEGAVAPICVSFHWKPSGNSPLPAMNCCLPKIVRPSDVCEIHIPAA